MTIKSIMLKECAVTAITNMEELKDLGTAHIKNSMLMECVKTVI
jgi:hypothetical protein